MGDYLQRRFPHIAAEERPSTEQEPDAVLSCSAIPLANIDSDDARTKVISSCFKRDVALVAGGP